MSEEQDDTNRLEDALRVMAERQEQSQVLASQLALEGVTPQMCALSVELHKVAEMFGPKILISTENKFAAKSKR